MTAPAPCADAGVPIFVNKAFSFGGTSVGTTQYVDAFQRANFWKFTKPGAINPGYHVLLSQNDHGCADDQRACCRCGAIGTTAAATLGGIEVNWLDNYLQKTLIPH